MAMGKGNSVSISKGGKTSSVANKKLKKMWRDRYMYLILIPVIAYYLIFCYAPMYGVTIAF